MTVLICNGCSRQTNTACCHHHRGNPPDYCYAAWEDGKWVKGCGFDKADDFSKAFAMHLITGKPTEDFIKRG